MIHPESFRFKNEQCKNSEYNKCDNFLNYFELDKGERAAIFTKTDSVGRHLKHVFKQGDAPANEYYGNKAQLAKPFPFRKLEMAIPSHNHKCIT